MMLPTVTGVGHANIGTGSDPRFHGIVVNNLFNRATGKSQEAYDQLDTRELMALTLADTWNLATDGKAIIIGQGGAIRATAGLVGRGACLISGKKIIAASYGGADGGWETNPACYTMPRRSSASSAARSGKRPAARGWATTLRARRSSAPRRCSRNTSRKRCSPSSTNQPSAPMSVTDLVFVNMKGPDYTAHAHGPDSAEQRETLAELDRQMAAYLALIDKKAGPGRSVTVITADHGTPGEPPPGGRVYLDDVIAQLNKRFDAEGEVHQLLQRCREQPAAPRYGATAVSSASR